MAVLPNVNMTFADLVKYMAPDGTIGQVAEILNETNEGMDEMTMAEGNLLTGHRHMVRTGLPTVTWGQLYKGVKPSRGNTVQATDTSGFLEALSEVDTRLLGLAPDPMAARYLEDRPFIESMSQEMWQTLWYGTAADPEKFIGLTPRFSDLTAANAENIVLGGSTDNTADKTSIWLVCWSPRTCFGFVPKGSQAGLKQSDEGEDWVTDASGGRYKIARTYFRWDMGLALPDWRYVVRCPNLRLSEITDDASTGPNLPFLLHDMLERLPSDAYSGTRVAFYANRKIVTKIRKQIASGIKGSTLQLREVGAVGEKLSPRKKFYFDDIPFNRSDTLRFTEARVV